MNTKTYREKKTFHPYDDGHFIVYLQEKIISKWVPDTNPGEEKTPDACTGYSYTGPELDGGTIIGCNSCDRDSLINGIIRSKYSQTEEDAIKTHQIILRKDSTCSKADDYNTEWNEFEAFRTEAISQVDSWLS